MNISNNDGRKLLADTLVSKLSSDFFLSFNLLNLVLVDRVILYQKFKKIIFTFMTKLDESSVSLSSELDKILISLVDQSGDVVLYDNGLISKY